MGLLLFNIQINFLLLFFLYFIMRIQVYILTPDCAYPKITAEQLILPTSTGQIGVLVGHAPLITALDIGPLILFREGSWTALAVIGGFGLVQDDCLTVLVNDVVD